MKNIIFSVWQLPQNIIGAIVFLFSFKKERIGDGIWIAPGLPGGGVSLGNFIFVKWNLPNTIKHEQGHRIQSMWFGPLYLFTVGIFSITRVMIANVMKGKWGIIEAYEWYYSGWPEKQADTLGGVVR